VALLFDHPNPLTITQILWVNLIMDTLAALAFGGEPPLHRFMQEKPKRRDEQIVSPSMWSAITVDALWVFVLSTVYLFGKWTETWFGVMSDASTRFDTGYFAFFVFAAVFNSFNARTDRFNLFNNMGGNHGFLPVMGIVAIVQILLVYVGGAVFQCHGLDAMQWLIVLVMAISIIPIDLIRKLCTRGLR
jgi:magnesium-transporting ATPase (P-type)